MAVRARTPEPYPEAPRSTARRDLPRDRSTGGTDIKRDPEVTNVGVHWSVLAVGVAAAA